MEVVVIGCAIVGLVYLVTHRTGRARPEPRWSHAAAPPHTPYRPTKPVRGARVAVTLVRAEMRRWLEGAGVAGGLPARFWAEAALAVMVVCGAGALAMFVARVAPWSVAPFAVIVAVAQLNGRVALSVTPHTSRQRWVGVWGGLPDVPQR